MDIAEYIASLHNSCAEATLGRGESHGVAHMDIVRENALHIWETMKDEYDEDVRNYMCKLIIAVAQMHDVADHKYGKTDDQIFCVRNALSNFFDIDDVNLIMLIIEHISFSKEEKCIKSGEKPNWDILGPTGIIVRNIVSDADKLEAIGVIGVERCIQFTKETCHKLGIEATNQYCIDRLIEHCDEKLFRLKDEFIRTVEGKRLAAIRQQEMKDEITRLQTLYSGIEC